MDWAAYKPVSVGFSNQEIWTPKRERRLIAAFIALGLLARMVRYFLCFPLWEDECFLCTNFIDRGYAELLQPLGFHQVAPVLFLWVELAAVQLFGFTEHALRLFPFLCSIAGLFLFWHLARRLLQGPALVMAIAAFAVAYPCIRYSAEAKQYGSDLFVSLGLFVLAVEWWRRPEQLRWLWGLVACLPLALGLSYPAVFSAGGISLFIALQLFRTGNRHGWLCWVVYNVVLLASFGGLYFLTVRPQAAAELGFMTNHWWNAFPPLDSPWELAKWLVITHSSNLLAYPLGGEKGASSLTLLAILAALFFLIRSRRYALVLLALAPLSLHFVAAAMERYPYGVHVKYSQYIAAFICLLMGLGIAVSVGWVMRNQVRARWALQTWLVVLGVIGAGGMIRDLAHPYKTMTDMRARAFARWFWFNASYDSEPVCLKSDLNTDFSPKTYTELSWSAMYLCNQRIYSPRHQNHLPPQWDRISSKRPLRVVHFKAPLFEYDQAAFQRWLKSMQTKYDLVGRDKFAFPCYGKGERRLTNIDHVEVYKFLPRAPSDTIRAAKQ